MLVRGLVRLDHDAYTGPTDSAVGKIAWMDTATPGFITFTKPTGAGDIQRIVGYCVQKDGSNNILLDFCPSPNWHEV